MKQVELKKVSPDEKYIEEMERIILQVFKKEIYQPLINEFPEDRFENSAESLAKALKRGTLRFYRGVFSGKLTAAISKDLRSIGAKFDKARGVFKLRLDDVPPDVQSVISTSEFSFLEKLKIIDNKLSKILPEEIADKMKLSKVFDASLWKYNKDIGATLKGISVVPNLTDESRAFIAKNYADSLNLYIKDFTEKEITRLRKQVQNNVFEKGNRYEALISNIQSSYEVSKNKAKFLARQETNLLMAKFKETRYSEAGVKKYKWTCVAGSTNHPVRPTHKKLDGTIQTWSNPPIVNDKGDRKNPGEDYGCRCYARPIVEF